MTRPSVAFRALAGMPEVEPGADLAGLVMAGLAASGLELDDGDVLVLAQKIVSKAEGRYVVLDGVEPTPRAAEIAAKVNKDPRFVEVVLGESTAVVRAVREVLITRHRLGYVMANAGVDRSNLGPGPGAERVLLLPRDPDASARDLRQRFQELSGVAPGVIISDSFGRPWRQGVVNVALGVAGLEPIVDLRGEPDRSGRPMQSTEVAIADAVAAGAGLVMGEAGEGTPAVHVRGLGARETGRDGRALLRPPREDLFL